MGRSTFELAMLLMKWIPLWLVDKILLFFAWFLLGDMQKYGLKRPNIGPLELKNKQGKTPVLDIGALAKIRSGDIKVVSGIKSFNANSVELIDGETVEVDSVILATGYRSNVPSWLQVRYKLLCFFSVFLCFIIFTIVNYVMDKFINHILFCFFFKLQEGEFFNKNGFPKTPFPSAWKGKSGLYAVGFTRKGLAGASFDAMKIAQDIGQVWKHETKQMKLTAPRHRRCISTF